MLHQQRWYGTPSGRLTSKNQHNTIHQQRWYSTPSGRLTSKDQHNTTLITFFIFVF
jgi:hypothetical protein